MVEACLHPLKRFNERIQEHCFMNLIYWQRHFKRGAKVWIDNTLMGVEDFLLGSFCILSGAECSKDVCYRFRAGLVEVSTSGGQLTLDRFV